MENKINSIAEAVKYLLKFKTCPDYGIVHVRNTQIVPKDEIHFYSDMAIDVHKNKIAIENSYYFKDKIRKLQDSENVFLESNLLVIDLNQIKIEKKNDE